MVSTPEQMQVPNGTGPGVRRSKRPRLASRTRKDNTNNATRKFDYRAIADRHRTVSWSNYGHPTGVVNLVYGPNLPTPATALKSKGHTFKIYK